MSALEQKIRTIAEPVIADHNARLVLVEFKNNTLQIMVEGADGSRMGVDDMAKLSKDLSPALEVEDPISGPYQLEISSPGIDRPLITLDDFETYIGFDAKVEVNPPIEGQKRFHGRITAVEDGAVTLYHAEKDQDFHIDHAAIAKAKLVLSDDLINVTKDKN